MIFYDITGVKERKNHELNYILFLVVCMYDT